MSDTFVAIRPIDPLDLTAHNFLLLVLQQHYFVGFTIIANGCSYRRTAAQELRSSQGRQSSLFAVLENSARRISGKYLLRPLVIHVEVFYRDAFTLSFNSSPANAVAEPILSLSQVSIGFPHCYSSTEVVTFGR
jgi:hypothetical protein